jgi:uncharacterized membrane protein
MNKSLIFRVSLLGLLMAVLTLFISARIERVLWLLIMILSAYFIAKNAPGRYFLHGFLTSLVNSVWVTGIHILFFNTYFQSHSEQFAAMSSTPLSEHPRVMMLVVGPIIGIVSGLVLGLFSFIISKMMKKPVTT